jgi:hypothetical protein
MDKKDLFRLLVDYHMGVNLEMCLSHIEDGRVLGTAGNALKENRDRFAQPYQGILILADGEKLAKNLIEDEVVLDEEIGGFSLVADRNAFFDYLSLDENSDVDGSYVFDSANSTFVKVEELNNNPRGLHEKLRKGFSMFDWVPGNFFSYSATESKGSKVGCKTRLAIKAPHAYKNVETFQIKRSPYTSFGMGKVTHFNRQGLVEEFFFMYDPRNKGPFIKPKLGIVGVYRQYENGPHQPPIEILFDGGKLYSAGLGLPLEKIVDTRKDVITLG